MAATKAGQEMLRGTVDPAEAIIPKLPEVDVELGRGKTVAEAVKKNGGLCMDIKVESPRHLVNLAMLQIRRELVDLARRYRGPESHATNHDSNSVRIDGRIVMRVEIVDDPRLPEPDLDRWTAFHDAALALPDEERQIFDLAWFLGADQAEVAEHLGCSIRTVKRRWDEIKRRLRDACDGGPPVRG